MKISFYQPILLVMIFGLISCGSGKDSPADSHPGSGSIKPGNEKDLSKPADSVKKDSLKSQTP